MTALALRTGRIIGFAAIALGAALACWEWLRDPRAPAFPLAPISTLSSTEKTTEVDSATAAVPHRAREQRSIQLTAIEDSGGRFVAGVRIVSSSSCHFDPSAGSEIARTNEVGHADFSIDSTVEALACLADGYVTKVVKLEDTTTSVQVVLSRATVLRGTIRLRGDATPPTSARVIAFPRGSGALRILECLRTTNWRTCNDCSVSVADTDGNGGFAFAGIRRDVEYELAVVGNGLIATNRMTTAKGEGEPVVIPVAYAYAARVEVADQSGRPVHVFSAAIPGAINGVTWQFEPGDDAITISNSSLILSDASPTPDVRGASRTFIATSDRHVEQLSGVTINIAIPSYAHSSIVAPLHLLDGGIVRHRATIDRTEPCLGDICISFTPSTDATVPEGLLRLQEVASNRRYEFPIHPNMLESGRLYSVRSVPCGEYLASVRWNNCGRIVPTAQGARLAVREGILATLAVDTSDLIDLTVKLTGDEIEDKVKDGMLLYIGREKQNAKDAGSAVILWGDVKPVLSESVTLKGLVPGRYCLLLQGGPLGQLAFEWVDVAGPNAQVTLTARVQH